jgi:hypothetical protein
MSDRTSKKLSELEKLIKIKTDLKKFQKNEVNFNSQLTFTDEVTFDVKPTINDVSIATFEDTTRKTLRQKLKDNAELLFTELGMGIEGGNGSYFKQSISISGDGYTVAVGEYKESSNELNENGIVKVYKFYENSWNLINTQISGENENDNCGKSISLSKDGTVLAIGFPNYSSGKGKVSVYNIFEGEGFYLEKKGTDIIGLINGDNFGSFVSLSSNGLTIGIGTIKDSSVNTRSGSFSVYKYDQSIEDDWSRIGSVISGDNSFDEFGYSLNISSDGTTISASSISNNIYTGYVKIYKFINDEWSQLGSTISGSYNDDNFGRSISLSEDGIILAIGSSSNSNTGQVKIYKFINELWVQLGSNIDGEDIGEEFGASISLSSNGKLLAVGSPNKYTQSGRIKLYEYYNKTWSQVGDNINGTNINKYLGSSVSLSSDGKILCSGSYQESNSQSVRVFELIKYKKVPNNVNDPLNPEIGIMTLNATTRKLKIESGEGFLSFNVWID